MRSLTSDQAVMDRGKVRVRIRAPCLLRPLWLLGLRGHCLARGVDRVGFLSDLRGGRWEHRRTRARKLRASAPRDWARRLRASAGEARATARWPRPARGGADGADGAPGGRPPLPGSLLRLARGPSLRRRRGLGNQAPLGSGEGRANATLAAREGHHVTNEGCSASAARPATDWPQQVKSGLAQGAMARRACERGGRFGTSWPGPYFCGKEARVMSMPREVVVVGACSAFVPEERPWRAAGISIARETGRSQPAQASRPLMGGDCLHGAARGQPPARALPRTEGQAHTVQSS